MKKLEVIKPEEVRVIVELTLSELGTLICAMSKSTIHSLKEASLNLSVKTVLEKSGDPSLKLYKELEQIYEEVE